MNVFGTSVIAEVIANSLGGIQLSMSRVDNSITIVTIERAVTELASINQSESL